MLTATYAQVAIVAEHNKVRSVLQDLQQCIQNCMRTAAGAGYATLKSTFFKLKEFHDSFRWRKIERHLLPSLRRFNPEAATLIDELESISDRACELLHTADLQLEQANHGAGRVADDVCESMGMVCHHIQLRLDREEQELMPLAQRLLSVEDWFGIAARFLSEEPVGGLKRPAFGAPWLPATSGRERSALV
ncbi:hypothetical protein SAMN06265795_10595 [Noviherbaspirillum humi]|uniref:Hemerythrin HHE cation binding domain-containing protein n=1 Tax=Noviherbaspirillum humi TaxID=1688639 RepID=A0A239GLX1_9BURK|nr:hemerythrin domain-containing protein [Noviherbaspirillum humi]SNS70110.1 hypothetical protein SAMN06265795_10595 [Noviherbaspirillum humi]